MYPADASGAPTAGAADIVFYSPYSGARDSLKKRAELRRYANALGMAIFTIEIKSDVKSWNNDMKSYYCTPESGWHKVFAAAHDEVVKRLGVEKKKLFLIGDSAGGSFAQQLATFYPERFDAVAITGTDLHAACRRSSKRWLI